MVREKQLKEMSLEKPEVMSSEDFKLARFISGESIS